jgi:hypothetical protein
MSSIKRTCLLFVFLAPSPGFTQEDLTGFLQPQVSLNYSLTPAYSHNFSVTQRVFFLNIPQTSIPTRHIDLAHFSNFKLHGDRSIGLGIMYRFREPFEGTDINELRLTEQANITSRLRVVRLGHRVRAEQRIFPLRTIHRFRYRFSADGPLQGEKLDHRELYWIGNLESLLSVGSGIRPVYGLRAGAWIGFLANASTRIQIGTEYRRVGPWLEGRPVLFLHSSLIVNL